MCNVWRFVTDEWPWACTGLGGERVVGQYLEERLRTREGSEGVYLPYQIWV